MSATPSCSRSSRGRMAGAAHEARQYRSFSVATWLIPLVFAIVLHEVSHGWVANAFGDPTARRKRRLSLNPMRHVDPIGTVALPLMLAVSGAPMFGWAKPVPVVARRLRNPRAAHDAGRAGGAGHEPAARLARRARPGLACAGWRRATGSAGLFLISNVANFLVDQRLPRRLQPAADPAIRRRPCRRGAAAAAAGAALCPARPLRLPLLILLLVVLPMAGVQSSPT